MVTVDFRSLVRALGRESLLTVCSDTKLANGVLKEQKIQALRNEIYAYGKAPTPICRESR